MGHHLTGDLLAVRESALEEAEEQPLRPAVVLGLVGSELAAPVDRPAEAFHLGADRRDVPHRHVARIPALLDRGVLGRQAERVEADRPQHVLAAAPPEVRDDLAEHVVAHVPHVQLARRIREHLEHVRLARLVLRPLRVRNVERARVGPDAPPLLLDELRVVALHTASVSSEAETR